jgi:RES domain-containing protein
MRLTPHPDSDRLYRCLNRCLPFAASWNGTVFRATHIEFATRRDLASGEGARLHGARWTPKGAFRTVYGSLRAEVALSELLEGHRRMGLPDVQALPVVLVGLDVSLVRVLDLTARPIQRSLGVSRQDMIGEPWEQLQRRGREALTQAIGKVAWASGLEGLLVPSAVPGLSSERNLVVFPDQLSLGSRVEIVHPEHLASRRGKKT